MRYSSAWLFICLVVMVFSVILIGCAGVHNMVKDYQGILVDPEAMGQMQMAHIAVEQVSAGLSKYFPFFDKLTPLFGMAASFLTGLLLSRRKKDKEVV